MEFSVFHFLKNDRLYPEAKIEYFNGDRQTNCCAFGIQDSVSLRLFLPRAIGALSCHLEFYLEDGVTLYKKIPLFFEQVDLGQDVYICLLKEFAVGLYFFRVVVYNGENYIYGYGKRDRIHFNEDKNTSPTLQYSVSEFLYPTPSEYFGGVIYHIFVDRFAKGGDYPAKEGALIHCDFTDGIPEFPEYPGAPLKNNTFYGGTLKGIEEKLPYLNELGVTLIYLSPIFSSPSNHKYDTADYMTVDSMFGGEKALVDLIREAEKYHIGIILDGVFNHTGADSIYFNRYGNYDSVGAYQSQESPYYNWYRFDKYPESYACWWGIEILPRIHPEENSLCEFLAGENGVIAKYSKLGIKGFRLDVVDELSDSFIRKIKATLQKTNPSSTILYGEVWEDASNKIAYGVRKQYFLGEELDGVMNYPIRKGIVDFLREGETGALSYALGEVLENTPKRILNLQMNLLGSHDTERIITSLVGIKPDGYSNAQLKMIRLDASQRLSGKQKLKMAYTILSTIPGIPSIYYGDETGLEGYSDPFNRMPFPWDNLEQEIVNHYVKLGQIRKSCDAYREGSFDLIHLCPDALIFSRTGTRYHYITVINNSDSKLYISTSRKHLSMLEDKFRYETTVCAYSSAVIRVLHNTEFEFSRSKERRE